MSASTPELLAASAELRGARARRRPPLVILASLFIVAIVVVLAVAGTALAPHDPLAQAAELGATAPSADHPLGTDDLGRDVLSRTMAGTRSAVVGPIVIALGAMIIGNLLGLWAGYRGGVIDSVVMRWVDAMQALPGVLAAVVVIGVVGGGYWLAVGILVLLAAPTDTRIIRGVTLEQRSLPYVDAARSLGLGTWRIMTRHLWPNVLPITIATTCLNFVFGLLALSALSFLGVGVDPGQADWGRMVAENRTLVFDVPTAAAAPALAIIITAVSVNLTGDWLYERLAERGQNG